MCEGNPLKAFLVGFFSFLGDPIGTIVDAIAKAVLAAAMGVLGALITKIPTLGTSGTEQKVNDQTQWIVVYLAVGSLIFASIRMAMDRRGDAGVTAVKGLLRVIAVSGAATTVVVAAAKLADGYADHLFAKGVLTQVQEIGCKDADSDTLTPFLLMVLAFLLLLSAIIHTILLYIRLGVMILLLGTLPLAAAASMTDWGAGWWRKHIGWMIAWLLYKPAVGLILYAGSAMIENSGKHGHTEIHERIAGIGVMVLSAVALPALLKLVVPATAALGGDQAHQQGMAALGGAVASGAKSVGGSALSGGGSGGASGRGGSAGPKGASGAAGGSGGQGSEGGGGRDAPPTGAQPARGPGAAAGGGRAGAAGGAGASGAAAAAGPAGAALAAAAEVAKAVGKTASGAVDGADGNAGHNQ
ncbi:hypothetical protein [Streptomyces sp. 8N616]|uniref:hypothetical protein n=1 Tax=Streptomyces sp. 8N616 TaxID=3457414 RepID=UPI003FD5FDBD